jgi:hypothetical protein
MVGDFVLATGAEGRVESATEMGDEGIARFIDSCYYCMSRSVMVEIGMQRF